MKQPPESRTEPAGVRLCGAAAVLLGFGETMLRGEGRCWARNTPPGTSDMFHKHTAKQDRVENTAGGVLGHGWGCSAADFWGQVQEGLWLLGNMQH